MNRPGLFSSPDRRVLVALLLFLLALYVPFAGNYGMWDPWETHYSEVAREILSRDDWITTWWAQEGWFMSKPVLIFWMSALGMSFGVPFGVRYAADFPSSLFVPSERPDDQGRS